MTAKTDKIGKYMMNNNYFASIAKDETPIGLARHGERLLDPIMWAWCWLAYRLVMFLPIRWRLWSWLLPFAGYYGFHVPDAPWRWSERRR